MDVSLSYACSAHIRSCREQKFCINVRCLTWVQPCQGQMPYTPGNNKTSPHGKTQRESSIDPREKANSTENLTVTECTETRKRACWSPAPMMGGSKGGWYKSSSGGIRHGTLPSFILPKMDRGEEHLGMAFPALTTCISHIPDCQEPAPKVDWSREDVGSRRGPEWARPWWSGESCSLTD